MPASKFSGNLPADLQRRQSELGRPVRIGLIGCGEMGTDIVTQCRMMQGITVAAIAEVRHGNAAKALKIAGVTEELHAIADTQSKLNSTIESGKAAITLDAQLICKSDQIDVVIDATGRPGVGAEIGLTAMEHGKHLVMITSKPTSPSAPISPRKPAALVSPTL